MSYLEFNTKFTPTGWRKVLHLNWPLVVLPCAVAAMGILMLYSVAGGDFSRWALPQARHFAIGLFVMFTIAFVPSWFWRNMSVVAYLGTMILLLIVEFAGDTGGGAQRWINLGFINLQPSELMKIALVLLLAAYYDWLPIEKVSHPLWLIVPICLIILPTLLVLKQPDLGTSLLLVIGGGLVMFLAGVHWAYFATVIAAGGGTIWAVLASRGTEWQLIQDYQFRRIDTFLDPSSDPLGAGYHITQAKIAMGSGGWAGKGFMQGTQSRLNFLPEKQTDFIFNTLAEEFGFIGSISLLVLYVLIIVFCIISGLQQKDRFGQLITFGIGVTFFLFFAVNMSMVMGLAPVVGVPLPLVSYGGSAMVILMAGFGLMQSAHIHRPR